MANEKLTKAERFVEIIKFIEKNEQLNSLYVSLNPGDKFVLVNELVHNQ